MVSWSVGAFRRWGVLRRRSPVFHELKIKTSLVLRKFAAFDPLPPIVDRSVAAESLEFLLDILRRVRARIESHVPASHAASVAVFYTRAVAVRGLVCLPPCPALRTQPPCPLFVVAAGVHPGTAGLRVTPPLWAVTPALHIVEVQVRGLIYHGLLPRLIPELKKLPATIAAAKWCVWR